MQDDVAPTTCIQFRQFIKECLTNWYKFCIGSQTVISSENGGGNRVILLQTVAKWRYIKLRAIFSGPLCIFVSWWHCRTASWALDSCDCFVLLVLSSYWDKATQYAFFSGRSSSPSRSDLYLYRCNSLSI